MTPGRAGGRRQAAGGSSRRSALRIRGSRLLPRGSAVPLPRGEARGSLSGFTLIELLIVISIIGILVTLAQPHYQRAVTAAKEATLKEDLFILRDVIDQYYGQRQVPPGPDRPGREEIYPPCPQGPHHGVCRDLEPGLLHRRAGPAERHLRRPERFRGDRPGWNALQRLVGMANR